MSFGSPKQYKCAVDKQPIGRLGARVDDLKLYDTIPGFDDDLDGANTELGPVCRVCAPAYLDARSELWLDPSVGNLRKAIGCKLKDSAFVNVSLRRYAQKMVANILEDLDTGVFQKASVLQLCAFLERCISFDDLGNKSEVYGGIDFTGARVCLNEAERTFKYFQALFARLDELTTQKPGKVLELVDAGSGPYALFASIAALKYSNVKATAIELNPIAAKISRRIVRNLGVSDRVEIVEEDATKYAHHSEIDLLVTETAFSGLLQEPIVQILANFDKQMADKSFMIPEWVTVEAGLVSTGVREFWKLENFALGPIEVVRMARGAFSERVRFVLEVAGLTGDYRLALLSKLGLAPGVELSGHDSNITKPVVVEEIIQGAVPGSGVVNVDYLAGSQRGDVAVEYLVGPGGIEPPLPG